MKNAYTIEEHLKWFNGSVDVDSMMEPKDQSALHASFAACLTALSGHSPDEVRIVCKELQAFAFKASKLP